VLSSKKWVNDTLQPFIRNTGPPCRHQCVVLLKASKPWACDRRRVQGAASIADFLAEQLV